MQVSEIYQNIAQNIHNSIAEEWQSAHLYIEAAPDWAKTNGNYITLTGEEKPIDVHQFDDLLEFELMELNELTTEGGHNRWNRAVFKLWPDGKFDMQFIWDQGLHDEIERLNNE